MSDVQHQVQQAIDDLVESGAERGLQVAVYQDGRQVVDAVAGLADPETGRPVSSGTVFHAYSVGKLATATVLHVLVERGLLSYDMPIAEVWPEFAAHGKQTATVRHILTHSVGVPGLPPGTTPEDLCDWDKMCQVIAEAEPWWEPGTKAGYHSFTYGYLAGEVVRRVTGKPISQVLREEVTGPLDVADELYFGVPASANGRLARLEDGDAHAAMFASIPDDSLLLRVAPRATLPTAAFGNRSDVLRADIPAMGRMSARAMARVLAALLGEVDGVRLVSPERLREITAVAMRGQDQVFGNEASWALGFGVGRLGSTPEESPTCFGWPGGGGSYAFLDTATGLTFAMMRNRLAPDLTTAVQLSNLVMRQPATG